jgi:hypothetical protein
VHREWDSEARLALIPLGRLFDAVRIPEAVVHHAFATHDQAGVARRLARHVHGGPVIHDPAGRRYYALVPSGTAAGWRAPAAECLGEGTYLGVPRPDLTDPAQGMLCSYWAVAVNRPGTLCQVPGVLTVAMAGAVVAVEDGEATS